MADAAAEPEPASKTTTWEGLVEAKMAAASEADAVAADGKTVEDLRSDRAFMDLYSRQIGAFGLDAMLKLIKMKVLIVGMRGVGVEVAKNTALAGVNTLTLFDPEPTAIRDLGSNFFLTEADVGKPRAEVCAAKVCELNPNVTVVAAPGLALTEELVGAHDAVVFTKGSKAELLRWNEFCRSRQKTTTDARGLPGPYVPAPIAFFSNFVGGVVGSTFVDMGPGYVLKDKDGLNPLVKIITKVEELETEEGEKYLLVRYTTPDGQPAWSMPDDSLIAFEDVGGMQHASLTVPPAPDAAEGAAAAPLDVNSLSEVVDLRCYHPSSDPVNTLRITLADKVGDKRVYVDGLSAWAGGGYINEKKEAVAVEFKSMKQMIAEGGPIVMAGDLANQGFTMIDMMSPWSENPVEKMLHVALQAVYEFEVKHGALPGTNNAAHAAEVFEMAKAINEVGKFVAEVDEAVVRRVAINADVELQPVCAFWGGVVAQELVKISGKFTPITQWFNFHSFEALPELGEEPTDTAPLQCRYDDQIAIYGKRFQEMLGNLRLFMVGCGALGCEFVKNFSLLGVCCGPNGTLIITDNDRIEVSNLNRQFLFREENVGQQKSVAAAQRARLMNKNIKIDSRQDLVGDKTEHIFDEHFWTGLDLVCNALDNMKARFYVDGRCVLFEKPLLESGTMGTGANIDIVVPHTTRSYSDGGQADEGGGVPMCTLRNFPNLIDHCIEWSRAIFEDTFAEPAQQAIKFFAETESFLLRQKKVLESANPNSIAKAVMMLENLKTAVHMSVGSPSIETCARMAWAQFHLKFHDKIVDLTEAFPADKKTESGDDFWTGNKKFPSAVTFDKDNAMHVEFLLAATNLFASMLKVHPEKHPSEKNDPADRWQAKYRDADWIVGLVSGFGVPERVKGEVDNLDGDAAKAAETKGAASGAERMASLIDELAKLSGAEHCEYEPADFEKDDDDNFHIDFITASSNLRAFNYQIPQAPREKCKMIAGRIIPAIATTTASVTGLVMLEMFKVLLNKPVEKLRNGNYSLGVNSYMMFEAEPPKKMEDKVVITKPDPGEHPECYDEKGNLKPEYKDPDAMLGYAEWDKYYPNPHTKYDKVWVEGCTLDMTLGALKEKVEAAFEGTGLELGGISPPAGQYQGAPDPDSSNPDWRKGIYDISMTLWSELIPKTNENLEKPFADLLLAATSGQGTGLHTGSDGQQFPILSKPADVRGMRLYAGLTYVFNNDDGDQVNVCPVVLKFVEFETAGFRDSPPFIERATDWLNKYSCDERLEVLELAKDADDAKIARLEVRLAELEAKLAA